VVKLALGAQRRQGPKLRNLFFNFAANGGSSHYEWFVVPLRIPGFGPVQGERLGCAAEARPKGVKPILPISGEFQLAHHRGGRGH
jgi:hypothetical protein